MTRRLVAPLVLVALIAGIGAAPGMAPVTAAASCTGWSSQTQPPATIRVFRAATGVVETVDFRAYVKNVLSREWVGPWTTESLRSGALAVKNYAWYYVLHWRGEVASGSGACFDVYDTTRDQVYDPSRTTWASAAAAVDATWSTLALRNGLIFPTYYTAGTAYEACGANANGWRMYQWGTQACGLAGRSAAQIMAVYYDGVVVSDAPLAAPPSPSPRPVPTSTPSQSPSPAATPRPTATPTATPPSTSPRASASPTQAATPAPTPAPTPRPTAPPPAPPAQPGGGQSSLARAAAPPAAPSERPKPIVVSAGTVGRTAAVAAQPATPAWHPDRRLIAGAAVGAAIGAWPTFARSDLRLVSFRRLFPAAIEDLRLALAQTRGNQVALPSFLVRLID